MHIYEQVDKTNNTLTYSWILDGVSYKHYKNHPLLAHHWKWIKGVGGKGCFVTNNAQVASDLAELLRLPIESNGSHKVHNAKGKLLNTR